MNNDLQGVINARLEKAEKELAEIDAKIKQATAPYVQQKAEISKDIKMFKSLLIDAGLMKAPKPMGAAAHRKG